MEAWMHPCESLTLSDLQPALQAFCAEYPTLCLDNSVVSAWTGRDRLWLTAEDMLRFLTWLVAKRHLTPAEAQHLVDAIRHIGHTLDAEQARRWAVDHPEDQAP